MVSCRGMFVEDSRVSSYMSKRQHRLKRFFDQLSRFFRWPCPKKTSVGKCAFSVGGASFPYYMSLCSCIIFALDGGQIQIVRSHRSSFAMRSTSSLHRRMHVGQIVYLHASRIIIACVAGLETTIYAKDALAILPLLRCPCFFCPTDGTAALVREVY